MIHVALFLASALWLPIGIAEIAPPGPGQEALWVPLLLLASIGPVFFVVSAQAPLMQRWFAADPRAGDPYYLYAASNLGSFAGLISRSEEHTSELQSLMRISYAVFCLKQKN